MKPSGKSKLCAALKRAEETRRRYKATGERDPMDAYFTGYETGLRAAAEAVGARCSARR